MTRHWSCSRARTEQHVQEQYMKGTTSRFKGTFSHHQKLVIIRRTWLVCHVAWVCVCGFVCGGGGCVGCDRNEHSLNIVTFLSHIGHESH